MYRRYGQYLRKRFKARVFRVSVDAGFTCPTLDGSLGTGGCTYCNNRSFRAKSVDRKAELRTQIEQGMARQRERYGAEKFIVYFQNYTNTYGPIEHLRALYEAALDFPDVVGLSISTRPDCVPEPVLALFAELAERTLLWTEIGLESSHDQTLARIQRGHDFACFVDAIERVAAHPKVHIATHVILGLPGESPALMLETIDRISALPIQGLKLHHLHVVEGTLMAREYRQEPFPLFTLESYAALLGDCLERLREDIIVLRLFGMCPDDILIGPHWNLRKSEILQSLEAILRKNGVQQGAGVTTRVT